MIRFALAVGMAAISYAAIAAEAPIPRELKLEFDELSAKAIAVIATVNAMEQRAAERNESLHPDLLLHRNLLEATMDDAEEALRIRDAKALGERLARARAYITRLSKML